MQNLGFQPLHPQAVRPKGSFDISGDTVLITGAMGRLGQIFTKIFEDAHCFVRATDTDAALAGDSPFKHCKPGELDITDPGDVERMQFTPTILINNAGIDDRPRAGVINGPRYDVAQSMVNVNLMGTYRMITSVGERMAKRGYGVIINMASLYGVVSPDMRYYGESGFEKHAMYGATKAGIINLTKYFGAYYAKSGVRVNALAPGGVVDPNDPLTGKDDTFKTNYTARIPMGRMCTPEDLKGPLLFLASQASSFMTGQTLILDGGFTAW